jgi:hypothetical protein
MPDVVVKDLCIDTTLPDVVAPFWAAALGLDATRQDGGDWVLRGEVKERTVWVNTVPEPLEVKNRVHLDVRGWDVPDATPVSQQERWDVLADPEGLLLCRFDPREGAPEGPFELVVDSVDPQGIAQWWADRTGATVHSEPGKPWVWLEGAAGFPYDYWVFQLVPEAKTVKNRVHWDVTLTDATVEDLIDAGAEVLDVQPSWTVMTDPEGNEFCAFPA